MSTSIEMQAVDGQGPSRALSTDYAAGDLTPLALSWKSISYEVPTKKGPKRLLDDLSGCVNPSEMIAIMGPSGAGKSTLLDALANRISKKGMQGGVFVNGAPRKGANFKRFSSYVMQDDALVGSMSVKENVYYSARLRLPHKEISLKEQEERILAVIHDLGLDRVANSRVGTAILRGISGGERRRVAVAIELITQPRILFLDEPTSGLDSTAGFKVMHLIQQIARKNNVTVIATIHQPPSSIFQLFDKLHLLVGGRNAYFGPRELATAHFSAIGYPCPQYENPADFFLNIINIDFADDKEKAKESINTIVEAFKTSKIKSDMDAQAERIVPSGIAAIGAVAADNGADDSQDPSQANGFLFQTMILARRSFINGLRDPIVYWVRVVMYVMLAVMMGTVWLSLGEKQTTVQDRLAALFFSEAFLAFMAVAATPAFLEERLIFERERASGAYSTGAYVLSTIIIALPFVYLISLSFSAIAYPLIGLHSGATAFFRFTAFLYLSLLVAESLVHFVSAAAPIFVLALAIVAFCNGFFMVVQGFFVRVNQIPRFWIYFGHYISFQRYGFELLLQNDLPGLVFDCNQQSATNSSQCFCNYPSTLNTQCQFTGDDVLTNLGYSDISFGKWSAVLIGMFLIFNLGFYAVLRLRPQKR